MNWILPAQVYENGIVRLLNEATKIDQSNETIYIDFKNVKYWMPAAIVYICALVNRWVEQEKEVIFKNHESCQAFSYLQRIDFFTQVGLELPEGFLLQVCPFIFFRYKRYPEFIRVCYG